MKKLNINLVLIFSISSVLLFAFQNCGKIEIQSQNSIMTLNSKTGTSYICLPDGYTLSSFFVTNLNVKTLPSGALDTDNDGDGLSDSEEIKYGYNPDKRRTSNKILDSICNTVDYGVNCANFNLTCNLNQNAFGINECDILALNLNQSTQLGTGIDSDKDDIPDYLEIRISSFPNMYDSYNDLDFDLINTYMEAERGTSVRNSNNNLAEQSYTRITKSKIPNSGCTGEYWKINVANLPTLPIKKFTDDSTGLLNLSHNVNENVIMTFLKIRPIDNLTSPAKTFSGIQKIRYDQNNLDTTFTINQNDLFYTGDVEQ